MDDRKSERPIVPMSPGDQTRRDPEEGRGRRGMEPVEGKMARALDLGSVSTRLYRIAELARRAPDMVIVTLAHHIDLAWMYEVNTVLSIVAERNESRHQDRVVEIVAGRCGGHDG